MTVDGIAEWQRPIGPQVWHLVEGLTDDERRSALIWLSGYDPDAFMIAMGRVREWRGDER